MFGLKQSLLLPSNGSDKAGADSRTVDTRPTALSAAAQAILNKRWAMAQTGMEAYVSALTSELGGFPSCGFVYQQVDVLLNKNGCPTLSAQLARSAGLVFTGRDARLVGKDYEMLDAFKDPEGHQHKGVFLHAEALAALLYLSELPGSQRDLLDSIEVGNPIKTP